MINGLALDRREVSLFGVAVLTNTPDIPDVPNRYIMMASGLKSNGRWNKNGDGKISHFLSDSSKQGKSARNFCLECERPSGMGGASTLMVPSFISRIS
jgi:hypothetical protein